jgi:hypothetical protein
MLECPAVVICWHSPRSAGCKSCIECGCEALRHFFQNYFHKITALAVSERYQSMNERGIIAIDPAVHGN